MMSHEAQSKRIVIAGGTGYLGTNLANYFKNLQYDVTIISRNPPNENGLGKYLQWDSRTLGDWVNCLEGASVLINLAGRTVDCIKSPDHCDEILRSRVESTQVLGKALRKVHSPPQVWIQMSTAHIYGDPPDLVCDESSAFGYGLAPFVGKAWEAAHQEALLPEMRSVILRTSFVLGFQGGALKRLATLVRCGLGGKVGHGRQGVSWIHEVDLNHLVYWAMTNHRAQGAYIATAPNPVSNAELMRELRRALRMPFGLPAAAWMVKLGAPLVMKTDPELALYGRYCVSTRLKEEGFHFHFPDITSALQDLYQTTR